MTTPTPPPTKDAPWGFKADGTPYKRDPKIYANRKPRDTFSKSSPSSTPRPDYRVERARRLHEFLTIPVSGLGITGQALGSLALVADAVALSQAAPAVSRAVADIAHDNAAVADVVDRLTASGPYAALMTALVPLAVQVAVNHSERLGDILVGTGIAVDPGTLLANFQSEKDGRTHDSSGGVPQE